MDPTTTDPQNEPELVPGELPPTPEPELAPDLAPVVASDPEPAPATTPDSKKPSWQAARLAKVTAQKAELERELARLKAGAPATVPGTVPDPTFEARVREETQRLATQAEFNRRCDEAADKGKAQFPDFEARITQLTQLVDTQDQASQAAYSQFLQVALATGEAPRILHSLGGDLDEAARIMALPTAEQAVVMTRMAMTQPPQAQVSGAPKPIRPVGARGPSHDPIDPGDKDRADKLSTAEWMSRREAQIGQGRGTGTRH